MSRVGGEELRRLLTRTVTGEVLVLDDGLGAGFHLEAGDPWLDGPCGIDALELEEGELVGVFGWQDLGVAAELVDLEAAR